MPNEIGEKRHDKRDTEAHTDTDIEISPSRYTRIYAMCVSVRVYAIIYSKANK